MSKKYLILVSLFYCSFGYTMHFPATMENGNKPPSEANCKFTPSFVSNVREFYENGESHLVIDFIDETMSRYEAVYDLERVKLEKAGNTKALTKLDDKRTQADSCMMFIRKQQ